MAFADGDVGGGVYKPLRRWRCNFRGFKFSEMTTQWTGGQQLSRWWRCALWGSHFPKWQHGKYQKSGLSPKFWAKSKHLSKSNDLGILHNKLTKFKTPDWNVNSPAPPGANTNQFSSRWGPWIPAKLKATHENYVFVEGGEIWGGIWEWNWNRLGMHLRPSLLCPDKGSMVPGISGLPDSSTNSKSKTRTGEPHYRVCIP